MKAFLFCLIKVSKKLELFVLFIYISEKQSIKVFLYLEYISK